MHRLTVLRESGGQSLMLVSSLPNATRPAPIGKPGEAVYAVRFSASYSGLHVLEIAASETPRLHFQGVIKTEERSDATPNPSFAVPNRGNPAR